MDREGYLTTAQVKEKYGLSRDAIYRRERQGKVKPYKFELDRRTYWKVEDVEALFKRPPEPRPQRWIDKLLS